LWRPCYLIQHSITLLLGQIALTQPGGVLGHCPVEKQIIVPLSANQIGWCITAACRGRGNWMYSTEMCLLHLTQPLWISSHAG
jgi:hypothetical protein